MFSWICPCDSGASHRTLLRQKSHLIMCLQSCQCNFTTFDKMCYYREPSNASMLGHLNSGRKHQKYWICLQSKDNDNELAQILVGTRSYCLHPCPLLLTVPPNDLLFITHTKNMNNLIIDPTVRIKSLMITAGKEMGQTAAVLTHNYKVQWLKPIKLIKNFQCIYGNALAYWQITTTVTNSTQRCTNQCRNCLRRLSPTTVMWKPQLSYFADSYVHLFAL